MDERSDNECNDVLPGRTIVTVLAISAITFVCATIAAFLILRRLDF
jgi:hypothetical protein